MNIRLFAQVDSQALGAGASGSVRRAVHKPSGRVLALKTINIADKSKRDQVNENYVPCEKSYSRRFRNDVNFTVLIA